MCTDLMVGRSSSGDTLTGSDSASRTLDNEYSAAKPKRSLEHIGFVQQIHDGEEFANSATNIIPSN